ncbi:MAG TPA: signal peptidase I [Nitrospinae bacterium]|nr:signal peptidase I [Nitrospinota bacterium]HBA26220.1 signal peptidase I [Nitrospinota bacterium]
MVNNILSCGKKDFSCLAETILKQGNSIRFKAKGLSMLPSIRNGDIVAVSPITDEITHGDIILYRSKENTPVVHRVIKKSEGGGILTKGDSSLNFDSPITNEQVLGKVIEVERRGINIRHILGKILRKVQGLRLYSKLAKVILKPKNIIIEQSAVNDEGGIVLNWAIQKGKRVIGYVDLSPLHEKDKNSVWIMTGLKVHYKYRRLNLGKKLVKEVLHYLNKIGADEVRLYVSPSNISAVMLYKKLGFTITDDATNNPPFKNFIYLKKNVKETSCHTSQIWD